MPTPYSIAYPSLPKLSRGWRDAEEQLRRAIRSHDEALARSVAVSVDIRGAAVAGNVRSKEEFIALDELVRGVVPEALNLTAISADAAASDREHARQLELVLSERFPHEPVHVSCIGPVVFLTGAVLHASRRTIERVAANAASDTFEVESVIQQTAALA